MFRDERGADPTCPQGTSSLRLLVADKEPRSYFAPIRAGFGPALLLVLSFPVGAQGPPLVGERN